MHLLGREHREVLERLVCLLAAAEASELGRQLRQTRHQDVLELPWWRVSSWNSKIVPEKASPSPLRKTLSPIAKGEAAFRFSHGSCVSSPTPMSCSFFEQFLRPATIPSS